MSAGSSILMSWLKVTTSGGGPGFSAAIASSGQRSSSVTPGKRIFGEEAGARVDHVRRGDAERRRQRGEALRDLHRADDQQAGGGS